MGHVVEESTPNGSVEVEFRRESVIFHEDESNQADLNLYGHDGHVEITYDYMRRIAFLLQENPQMRASLLGSQDN